MLIYIYIYIEREICIYNTYNGEVSVCLIALKTEINNKSLV